MGRTSRQRPLRLASKLLAVRQALGFSQNELIRHLGMEDELIQGTISAYELGNREPSLLVLLGYARVAGVYLDVLVDDELDLPERLPASPKSEGRRSKMSKKQTRRR
jgi:transcriptional regulator with XRE-family HTH domain